VLVGFATKINFAVKGYCNILANFDFNFFTSIVKSINMPKAFLMILDGWGIGPNPSVSAIAQANTPFMDSLLEHYPHTTLTTHGEEVGLPDGQMGNSEVGHLNIGAGRVVYQELARINKAVREGELRQHPTLLDSIRYARENQKNIHLMGLLSDGGVHSHINHLLGLCDILRDEKEVKTYIHAFTDGRDTDPKGGAQYIDQLLRHIKGTPISLATVIGRYYAMDRDKRWERVKKAYDLLIHADGKQVEDWASAVLDAYREGITDEFLPGMTADPKLVIEEGDVVIFFNFRTDRPRELVEVLSQTDNHEYNMHALDHLRFVTFTRYDERFRNISVLFEKEDISHTLGEVLSAAGKKQIRIAETEKYPHVTFFFNGGREEPFEGEERILIPSPKVATYDLQPEMSAPGIRDAIIEAMAEKEPDFICLNFANPDMVGHTGVMEAAVKAVECVDACVAAIVPEALKKDYRILIIADHGNADYMVNDDGSPNTAHTTFPVPCILVSNHPLKLQYRVGKLGDIAPTLLDLMGLEKSQQMDGLSLMDRSLG